MSTSKSTSCDHYDGRKGEIMRMGYLKKLKQHCPTYHTLRAYISKARKVDQLYVNPLTDSAYPNVMVVLTKVAHDVLTMKKKFFILRGESSEASARLEYYDSEKKWRNAQPPKRTISLKTCFNINRRKDTKHKYVIALYTKDDCFCIVLDSEEELQEWLKVLLKLQTGEDCVDGEQPKPNFEHVWKVNLQEKGLGDSKNLVGPYHVCLTDQTLTLVKITEDDAKPETLEFPLIYIRSCGVTGSFFYIEVGRQTVTGAGALWMLTEDANIAKNMNAVIFSAFSVQQKDQKDVNPHRKRSSSATESSKPISLLQRRQTHGPSKPLVPSGYSAVPVVSSLALPAHSRTSALHCVPRPPSQRRHSVSAMSSSSVLGTNTMVQHQRTNSIPLSPYSESSESCNGPSTVPVVHQRTKSCPISETSVPGSLAGQTSPSELPQKTTNPSCPIHRDRINSQSSIDFAHSHAGEGSELRRSSISGRRTSTVIKSSTTGTRERRDSMPSRSRTTSEGGHHVSSGILPHSTRIPHHGSRPHSIHSRGLSHSPPAASGPCSTDSAGSSVSIDDGELDLAISATSPRYGHSSTPDEPAILEENCNNYCHWPQENEDVEKMDDYVPMEQGTSSLSLPIYSTGMQRKVSAPASLKSSSPLHSFTDVCSPCGSSPLETGNYLPMSPGESGRRVTVIGTIHSANHSRGSSLAEETPDGYVPMAPNSTDDGYVDMEPLPGYRLQGEDCHHSDMSPGSSCSFTSGTPSTDLRFSEYHLEKVSSYLTPSEEDEMSLAERPSRTYSFGSQPETTKSKGKTEVSSSTEAGRVRAFSVGSKWGRPRNLTKETHKLPWRSHILPQSTKSSSAPLLSSSWSGTSRHVQSSNDPMADLMEIDFTENKKKKRSTSSRFRVTPVMESSSQINIDMKNSHQTVTSSADSGYMDMSSKSPSGIYPSSKTQNGSDSYSASPPSVISSSPRTQGYNANFGKSPPKHFLSGRSPPKLNCHLGRSPPKSSPLAGLENASSKPFFSSAEMSRSEPKNARLTKPAIISSSALKTIGEKPDVKPQKFPTTSSANLNIYTLPNKMQAPGTVTRRGEGAYMDMRVGSGDNQQTKDDQSYMEMGGRNNKKFSRANSDKDVILGTENKNQSEGYVEMSYGGKLTRKLSGDGLTSNSFDDYMPMSGGSQPIAIKGSSSSASNPASNPPKVPTSFLALGSSSPFNSIRRNSRKKNRRKHERRESKESITTPTGSNSAIFPMSLSSPTSPKKMSSNLTEMKDNAVSSESTETSPVDGSVHAAVSPNDEDSPTYEEMTPGVVELDEKCFSENAGEDAEVSTLSDPLNRLLRISKPSCADYVNYSPQVASKDDEDVGDYACMKPGDIPSDIGTVSSVSPPRGNTESGPETPSNASTGVPLSATANISDPTSGIAQKQSFSEREDELQATRQTSSQLSYKSFGKPKPHTPKDNDNSVAEEKADESLSRLSSSSIDNSRVSSSTSGSAESGDRKSSLKLMDNHPSVTRQVSSSSSSSTEVVSIKEVSSPVVPPTTTSAPSCGASRPSSTSSERDITYASLDLGPSGSEGEECGRSPRGFRTQTSLTESSGSSPSPNPTVPSESFNYVKIDFEKSGSLRTPDSFSKKIHY